MVTTQRLIHTSLIKEPAAPSEHPDRGKAVNNASGWDKSSFDTTESGHS